MRLFEMSPTLVGRAMGKRVSNIRKLKKLYQIHRVPLVRNSAMKQLSRFKSALPHYAKRFPGAVEHLRLSDQEIRDNFLFERALDKEKVARIKEDGFNPDSSFPMQPYDSPSGVSRNDYGVTTGYETFDNRGYNQPFQGQQTPLTRPKSSWNKLLKAGALTGLAMGGLWAASGAARGALKWNRARSVFNTGLERIKAGKSINLAKAFGKKAAKSLGEISNKEDLLKARNIYRKKKGDIFNFIYRGGKKAFTHPWEHLKAASGYNAARRFFRV